MKTALTRTALCTLLCLAGAAHADVKIGLNVPLTGFAAADGKSALEGAKLAVAQANAAGGIKGEKIELVVYDDQASPKEAAPIATKLIEKDKVVIAVSGSYSASTRAAAPVSRPPRCLTSSPTRSTRTSPPPATTCSAPRPWARCRAAPAPS